MTNKINEETKKIAARLKEARIKAGYYSARTFVKKANISPSTYSHHETGKRSINIATAKHYCSLLGINPSWLLLGKDDNDTSSNMRSNEEEEFLKILNTPIKTSDEKDDFLMTREKLLCLITTELVRIIDQEGLTLSNDEIAKKSISMCQNIFSKCRSNRELELTLDIAISEFTRYAKEIAERMKKKELANIY